ncbi:hypothetical protein TNCV_119061 [Trichonephila clavipes]|nr:hypothetical protein TNCV_119061 [Trichonephila clavipes]
MESIYEIDHLGVNHRISDYRNTLTLKAIELPLRSAIVRVSVVSSHLFPISPAYSCLETIVLALVCISEFSIRNPDISI